MHPATPDMNTPETDLRPLGLAIAASIAALVLYVAVTQTRPGYWAFLPFVLPIGLWVAWSDIARMKIPNQAVVALILVFLVVGPFVLPLADWGWRWAYLVVVLIVGFLANMVGMMGAGDAKFMAAAAPYVALSDVGPMMLPFALLALASIAVHRALRGWPRFRNAVPGWESWTNPKFPFGLALGPALIGYVGFVALYGV